METEVHRRRQVTAVLYNRYWCPTGASGNTDSIPTKSLILGIFPACLLLVPCLPWFLSCAIITVPICTVFVRKKLATTKWPCRKIHALFYFFPYSFSSMILVISCDSTLLILPASSEKIDFNFTLLAFSLHYFYANITNLREFSFNIRGCRNYCWQISSPMHADLFIRFIFHLFECICVSNNLLKHNCSFYLNRSGNAYLTPASMIHIWIQLV